MYDWQRQQLEDQRRQESLRIEQGRIELAKQNDRLEAAQAAGRREESLRQQREEQGRHQAQLQQDRDDEERRQAQLRRDRDEGDHRCCSDLWRLWDERGLSGPVVDARSKDRTDRRRD